MSIQCAYCGSLSRKNDICGHGVADGICCICEDCHSELDEDEDEDTFEETEKKIDLKTESTDV
jgi:hypothetical protein